MLDKSFLVLVLMVALFVDNEGKLFCRPTTRETRKITLRSLSKHRISTEQPKELSYQLVHFLEESLKSTKIYQSVLDKYVLFFYF